MPPVASLWLFSHMFQSQNLYWQGYSNSLISENLLLMIARKPFIFMFQNCNWGWELHKSASAWFQSSGNVSPSTVWDEFCQPLAGISGSSNMTLWQHLQLNSDVSKSFKNFQVLWPPCQLIDLEGSRLFKDNCHKSHFYHYAEDNKCSARLWRHLGKTGWWYNKMTDTLFQLDKRQHVQTLRERKIPY